MCAFVDAAAGTSVKLLIMKIDKINDNQIRFVLTKEDLTARQMKLSELAYGTDKAKALFREMMQQAALQYGFDADNMPLMIEAVPLSGDSIVLVVTKVDNPEELDSRFANYVPGITANSLQQESPSAFEQLITALKARMSPSDSAESSGSSEEPSEDIRRIRDYMLTHRLYEFSSMSDLISMASVMKGRYSGESELIYDEDHDVYGLFLTMKDMNAVSAMQNVLAGLSEYGTSRPLTAARRSYLTGHCRIIFPDSALEKLSSMV